MRFFCGYNDQYINLQQCLTIKEKFPHLLLDCHIRQAQISPTMFLETNSKLPLGENALTFHFDGPLRYGWVSFTTKAITFQASVS